MAYAVIRNGTPEIILPSIQMCEYFIYLNFPEEENIKIVDCKVINIPKKGKKG